MDKGNPQNDTIRVLVTEEQLAERVRQMGSAITEDYRDAVERGEKLVLICLLRGSAIFVADLCRAIHLPLNMDFMQASSYGNNVVSSGNVKIKKDLTDSIEGKHVIIVEDVVDSGLTLSSIGELLRERGPLSVEIAAMVRKDVDGQIDVPVKYLGFEVPNEFLVGYGLDYAEYYRNIPSICVLKPEIYS